MRCVTLAAMTLVGRTLGKAARVPPDRQRNGMEAEFRVALARQQVTVYPEELLSELQESLYDVGVAVSDAEADALRVQRAVTHEVSDELGKFRRHRAWNAGAVIRVPVQVAKRRQRDFLRLAHHLADHHRHTIAFSNLGHSAPCPVALIVHDLDPMSW